MSQNTSPTLKTQTLNVDTNATSANATTGELLHGQTVEVLNSTETKKGFALPKFPEVKFTKEQAYKVLEITAIAIAVIAAIVGIVALFVPAISFLAVPMSIVASAAGLYVLAPKAVKIVGQKFTTWNEARKAAKETAEQEKANLNANADNANNDDDDTKSVHSSNEQKDQN